MPGRISQSRAQTLLERRHVCAAVSLLLSSLLHSSTSFSLGHMKALDGTKGQPWYQ